MNKLTKFLIPLNRFMPAILTQLVPLEISFTSIKELVEIMPYGLNKKKAKNIFSIIQFNFSGQEQLKAYLIIKNQKCEFVIGTHPNPNTIINVPSEIWLKIANKKISGTYAYLNNMFEIKGDATILPKLFDLFSNVKPKPKINNSDFFKAYKYGCIKPSQIKSILVIDGGYRGQDLSKSTFMAKIFCNGAKSKGAEVDYIFLKDKNIHPCTGCYTCWTKTPGKCVYKDDMPDLLEKMLKADLVVFVSPLFVFSVTGLLKTFLDRVIPNIKPDMVSDTKRKITKHPERFQGNSKGIIVFSASGFPEIKGNFDGLANIFRNIAMRGNLGNLIAEFYLPASELITQPVYADRLKLVEQTCFQAGQDLIEQGRINLSDMLKIANPNISQEDFAEGANVFWESIIETKMTFNKKVPKLEICEEKINKL